jgi:hypothetical protein
MLFVYYIIQNWYINYPKKQSSPLKQVTTNVRLSPRLNGVIIVFLINLISVKGVR